MKKKQKTLVQKLDEAGVFDKNTLEEIKRHGKLDETWCSKEKKFVYNPKKKRHCPFCGELL